MHVFGRKYQFIIVREASIIWVYVYVWMSIVFAFEVVLKNHTKKHDAKDKN